MEKKSYISLFDSGSGGGHPAPEVDVSQTHNGTARRARSRAGSVSFPDRSDMMSPSLEKQMMPHQVRDIRSSDLITWNVKLQLSNSGSANYVELCFPAQVNMNGSQPNLASMPINKVQHGIQYTTVQYNTAYSLLEDFIKEKG